MALVFGAAGMLHFAVISSNGKIYSGFNGVTSPVYTISSYFCHPPGGKCVLPLVWSCCCRRPERRFVRGKKAAF
jgi:hypothetical protein